jgi:hypothetical protein
VEVLGWGKLQADAGLVLSSPFFSVAPRCGAQIIGDVTFWSIRAGSETIPIRRLLLHTPCSPGPPIQQEELWQEDESNRKMCIHYR